MPNITKEAKTRPIPEYVYVPGVSWSGVSNVPTYDKWYSPNVNRQRRNELATRGWMTPTPYYVEETFRSPAQLTRSRGRQVIIEQPPGYYWRGDGWFPYPPIWGTVYDQTSVARWADIMSTDVTSLEAKLKAEALSGAISRMRNQNVSVVETFAEAKKSCNMILSHVTRVAQAIGYVKRGKFQSAAKALGLRQVPANAKEGANLSSNWLAYRYGWMPMYLTVYGAMQNIYDYRKRSEGSVYRVNSAHKGTISSVATATLSTSYLWSTWVDRTANKADLSVRCELTYKLASNTRSALSEWGLTNPVLVAWELLPLSFVADWFVNISDVLERIDALEGKEFCCGTYTVKRFDTTTVTPEQITMGEGVTGSTPGCTASRKAFKREVFLTLPYVQPRLLMGLNTTRIIDAAALIRQFTR